MRLLFYSSLLTVAVLYFVAAHAQGNPALQPVTSTYVLKGATIIPAPGAKPEQSMMLIERGRIAAIGTSISVPAHARVIQCDSLYIYPGFIDGLSHTGIEAPKPPERSQAPAGPTGQGRAPGEIRDPYNPPNDQAGITPEVRVRDILKTDDKSIEEMRKLGFTMSHVVPRGRMLPGMGAIVSLGTGTADKLLVREDVSVFSQFAGASQMYPSTVIAVIARWRELFHQATYAQAHQAAFDRGAAVDRPRYDRATLAFAKVTSRDVPVYFKTLSALEMSRALALQRELGFRLVLADTKQAFRMKDDILKAGTSVVVSLSLPADKSEKPKKEEQKTVAPQDTVSMQTADAEAEGKVEAKDPEQEALNARRKASYEEHCSQAAVLAAAGVPIAFSLLDVKPGDIRANLRNMIAHGLSEDQALAALTVNAAKLLGIEHMAGTVAQGKLANLVVTTAPYFSEKSQVRYVFVEGVMYEYEIKSKSDKKSDDGEPSGRQRGDRQPH